MNILKSRNLRPDLKGFFLCRELKPITLQESMRVKVYSNVTIENEVSLNFNSKLLDGMISSGGVKRENILLTKDYYYLYYFKMSLIR